VRSNEHRWIRPLELRLNFEEAEGHGSSAKPHSRLYARHVHDDEQRPARRALPRAFGLGEVPIRGARA